MAQQFPLAVQLVNLGELSNKNLEGFCRCNNIITEDRQFIYLRNIEKPIFFTEQAMKEALDSGKMAHPKNCLKNLTCMVLGQQELRQIEECQKEIQNFLDACVNGTFPRIELLQFFQTGMYKNYFTLYPDSQNPWHMLIGVSDKVRSRDLPFEDIIYFWGILNPFLEMNSPVKFEYTKKCALCGKFYQAKGPKTIYCSERCRSRARALAKKKEMGDPK